MKTTNALNILKNEECELDVIYLYEYNASCNQKMHFLFYLKLGILRTKTQNYHLPIL